MGRPPCCDKSKVKKGPWTAEEDAKLLAHIARHGTGNWTSVPKKSGLKRCGKSCRLRWTNYLRPDLNHGCFTAQEEQLIVSLHAAIGSRWSLIAAQLPGRTDNDVKNHWNTRLRKKLCEMGIDPVTHKPISQILADYAGNVGLPAGNDRHLAKARISCLSKDLRNAYTPNGNDCPNGIQAQQPHKMHDPDRMNTMRPDGYNGVSDTSNFWYILAQLHAIETVGSSDQPEPTNFHPPASSGAIAHGRGDEGEICTRDLLPANDNTTNPQFTWREFLLEDELELPPQQQSDDQISGSNPMGWISASPTDSNCSPLLSYPRHVRKPQVSIPAQQNHHENGILNSCISLQMQDQYSMDTMKASPSYSARSCCSKINIYESPTDVSSLDAVLLDSEYPLFWEFPDLEDPA